MESAVGAVVMDKRSASYKFKSLMENATAHPNIKPSNILKKMKYLIDMAGENEQVQKALETLRPLENFTTSMGDLFKTVGDKIRDNTYVSVMNWFYPPEEQGPPLLEPRDDVPI